MSDNVIKVDFKKPVDETPEDMGRLMLSLKIYKDADGGLITESECIQDGSVVDWMRLANTCKAASEALFERMRDLAEELESD